MNAKRVAVLFTVAVAAGSAVASAQTPDGQALYREHCRSCHGAAGVPPQRARDQYRNIPSLADSAFLASRSDDSLLVVLRRGARRGRDMESFSAKMSEAEMRAVIAFVRTLPRRHAQ